MADRSSLHSTARQGGFVALGVLSLVLQVSHAHAQAQGARAAASAAFREAESAERAGKFREAATHYAEADALVPNDDVLAAALEMAEKADAPTLAMRLVERATPRTSARLQTIAVRVEKTMAPRSARLKVECERPCTATLDGSVFALDTDVWVDPGPHDLGYQRGTMETPASRKLVLEAGKQLVLTMVAPPAKPDPVVPDPKAPVVVPSAPPPIAAPPAAAPVSPEVATTRNPLPPWVFFVATGVTAAVATATVVSAFDVKGKHDDFVLAGCLGAQPPTTCSSAAESGTSAQTRTNVLLGVTAGLTVATAALAVFFVDWSSEPRKKQLARHPRWAVAPRLLGASFYSEWP